MNDAAGMSNQGGGRRWHQKTFLVLTIVGVCLGVVFDDSGAVDTNSPANEAMAKEHTGLPVVRVSPGFSIEAVAVAPTVANPVALAFDENGRLFVAEAFGPNPRTKQGRIRVLEDPDEKGVYRASTVLADRIVSPSSLACYGGGVFVTATPDILFLKGSQGGSVADTRRVVFSGFGGTNTGSSGPALLHSLQWGLDNRIHGGAAGLGGNIIANTSAGQQTIALEGTDFSFDPRNLLITPSASSSRSGMAFDEGGRKFVSDFTRPLLRPMYEYRHLVRNPFMSWPRPLVDVANAAAPVFSLAPVAQTQTTGTVASTTGQARPRNELTTATWLQDIQDIVIYQGAAFGSNYAGNVFMADPGLHLVHRAILRDNGLQVTAIRSSDESRSEFASSSDDSFRPMQVRMGPDGALYVADAGVEEGGGAIWRIAPAGLKTTPAPKLGRASTRELVENLANQNGWRRNSAARLLYERQDPAAVPLLTNMLNSARVPFARLHALRVLAGMGALSEAQILRALRDSDERVRLNALEILDREMPQGSAAPALMMQFTGMTKDPSAQVRYQLAFALGEVKRPEKVGLLAELLNRDGNEPWVRKAVLSSAADQPAALFTLLAANPRVRNDRLGQDFLLELAGMTGLIGPIGEITAIIDLLSRGPIGSAQLYSWVHALGDGLMRGGSFLGVADPDRKLQPVYSAALDVATSGGAMPAVRVEAIGLLGISPYTFAENGDWLLALVVPAEPLAVQVAAVRALGQYDDPRVFTELLQRWPRFSPVLRRQAVNALLARVERAAPLLDAIDAGRVSLADLGPIEANILRTHPDANVARHARDLLGSGLDQRQQVLERYAPAVKLTGSVTAGAGTFQSRCGSCHDATSQQSILADVLSARTRGKEKLLLDIIDPDREISSESRTHLLVSRTGELRAGTVTAITPESITLKQPAGDLSCWPMENLRVLETRSWSVMPDGLEQGLSLQAMADLLTFTMAR